MSVLNDAAVSRQATIYRVGYRPDPFAWTPWEYSEDGHFTGRWDDPHGRFRTLYVADSLLGCLLEVPASFRPDLHLLAELNTIVDADNVDAPLTAPPGQIPLGWLDRRTAGSANPTGAFLDVRDPATISIIRQRHANAAARLGLSDLDAAALKLAAPRTLTQVIAVDLYTNTPSVDGVCFSSRHGDTLTMWAIFEHPGEHITGTPALTAHRPIALTPSTPEIDTAFQIHNLSWAPVTT